MIKDIGFVCYPVSDMRRARKFYEGVLGLVPSDEFGGEENASWIEYNIGNSTISLGHMDGWNPVSDGPNMALEVTDFDDLVQRLQDNKVEFKMDVQHFPNCSMAIIKDTEGNLITIHHKK